MSATKVLVVVGSAIAIALAGACVDPQCPRGYDKRGDTCYRQRDAGDDAAVADGGSDAELQVGAEDARPDGSSAPDDAVQVPFENHVLAEGGASCSAEVEQTLACEGHASSTTLKCERGTWKIAQTCGSKERCDSRVGTEQGKCTPVPPACLGQEPGDACDGALRVTCGVDLVTVTANPCQSHAHCDIADAVHCACDVGWSDDGRGTCTNGDDACNPGPCQHGGLCSRTAQGASCDCSGTGYGGATCQTDIDECASANLCTLSEYPCVQTEPPGYTCRGQMADWPMPDSVAGAKVTPSYDSTTLPGIVIDNVTGLEWQRLLPDSYPGCTGNSGLAGDTCTWQQAIDYCENLVHGGRNDWRLPTKIELESILDDTQATEAAFNPGVFPGVATTAPAGIFWSSSSFLGMPTTAWTVAHSAQIGSVYKTQALRVRCVRSGRVASGTPDTRYVISDVNGEPTVTDRRTGLVWQRNFSQTQYTLPDAKVHCMQLGSGWRVPTKKELLTLADPGRTDIDPKVFPGAGVNGFWSSSRDTRQTTSSIYWRVNMTAIGSLESSLGLVRCVR